MANIDFFLYKKFPLLLQYLSDDEQSNIGDEIEDYDKNLKESDEGKKCYVECFS